MRILVLNTGSSSVKYKLFQMPAAREAPAARAIAAGIIERIGEPGQAVANHAEAIERIFRELDSGGRLSPDSPLAAVGHRVVHGGNEFRAPAVVDPQVMEKLRQLDALAPLHNPAARGGIEAVLRIAPQVLQVLVFDTAFFQSLAPEAYRYALPDWCYDELAIRRYGFHGTSHQYVSRQAAAALEQEGLDKSGEPQRMITLHLGNGASAAAILGGVAIDTSMGLTPLEGLVMGTRSGDLDPAVVAAISRRTGRSAEEVERVLNYESGLRGLCGERDMREVLRRDSEGDAAAALAVQIYVRRIQKYIGSYFAVLGGLDALIFTAGVGEHATAIRARVCRPLGHLGIELDPERNESRGNESRGDAVRRISTDRSPAAVFVVTTDEERAIAEQVAATLAAGESAAARARSCG